MKRYQGKTYDQSMSVFFEGAGSLINVATVLALAWTLSSICNVIGTGPYLASLIGDNLNPAYFPIAVFLFGAMMSFATGSSYGTFAILMATTLPVANILGADLVLTIAAILSGGYLAIIPRQFQIQQYLRLWGPTVLILIMYPLNFLMPFSLES